MRNGAYTLAGLSAVLGLVLLTVAGQGSGLSTSLGTVLMLVAVLLAGLGKGINLLGHVREGAADPDERE
jgi:hypothetical protein